MKQDMTMGETGVGSSFLRFFRAVAGVMAGAGGRACPPAGGWPWYRCRTHRGRVAPGAAAVLGLCGYHF